jgi:hypothetical protein
MRCDEGVGRHRRSDGRDGFGAVFPPLSSSLFEPTKPKDRRRAVSASARCQILPSYQSDLCPASRATAGLSVAGDCGLGLLLGAAGDRDLDALLPGRAAAVVVARGGRPIGVREVAAAGAAPARAAR